MNIDEQILKKSLEAYKAMQGKDLSDEDKEKLLHAISSKPKFQKQKFSLPAHDKEYTVPDRSLLELLKGKYLRVNIRNLDPKIYVNNSPSYVMPKRIIRLTKALLELEGRTNIECRVLEGWRIAVIFYMMSGTITPPECRTKEEQELSSEIQNYVESVIYRDNDSSNQEENNSSSVL